MDMQAVLPQGRYNGASGSRAGAVGPNRRNAIGSRNPVNTAGSGKIVKQVSNNELLNIRQKHI